MPWWRRPLVLSAVGAAAAAAVVITVVAVNSGDETAGRGGPAVTYDIGASGPIMASACRSPTSSRSPEPTPSPARSCRSTARWWFSMSTAGTQAVGTRERVQLRGADQSVALDGVDFVVGEDYLVTAAESTVQVCGVSGPATAELRAALRRVVRLTLSPRRDGPGVTFVSSWAAGAWSTSWSSSEPGSAASSPDPATSSRCSLIGAARPSRRCSAARSSVTSLVASPSSPSVALVGRIVGRLVCFVGELERDLEAHLGWPAGRVGALTRSGWRASAGRWSAAG